MIECSYDEFQKGCFSSVRFQMSSSNRCRQFLNIVLVNDLFFYLLLVYLFFLFTFNFFFYFKLINLDNLANTTNILPAFVPSDDT